MTTVVSIGCSHTHGSMIDGKNGTSQYNKNHAFGPQLAKMHGWKYINMGVPGGSNTYIFRAAINFLQKHYKDNNDYLFLIGWTCQDRMELRYADATRWRHHTEGDLVDTKYIPFTVGTSKGLMKTYQHRKLLDLAPLFFDRIKDHDEWAGYAFGLQNIFKQKNIKYLMFNTCQAIEETRNNKNVVKKLDTEKYLHPLNEDQAFVYWALNRGFKKTKCWHHKEDAHIAWAEYLNIVCKNLDYC